MLKSSKETQGQTDEARMACISTFLASDDYLAPDFVERKVRLCSLLGATDVFFFIHARGLAPNPSRFMPSFPGLQEDLLSKLVKAHHDAGIRFFACWCAVNECAAAWIGEHPDWVQVNPDGSKGICLCYNGPAREAILGQVREVLKGSPVDAIYFDQLPVACFCPACKEAYQSRRGQPMPKVASAPWIGHGTPVYVEAGERIQDDAPILSELESFSEENLLSFLHDVKSAIKELRPTAHLLVNKVSGRRCAITRPYVDGYLPEVVWWHTNGNIHNLELTRLIGRAYHDAPMWAEVKYDVLACPIGRPVKEVEVLAAEAVASRFPVVFRDMGALERDAARAEVIGQCLQELGQIWTSRHAARPVTHAALIHSSDSERKEPNGPHLHAVQDLHTFLIQHQIPCTLVTEETLCKEGLDGFNIAILSEAPMLSAASVTALQQFVANGGGLLGIGRIGVAGEGNSCDLSRALEPLFGVSGDTVVPMPVQTPSPRADGIPIMSNRARDFTYARLRKGHPIVTGIEGREVHFHSGYVSVEPGTNIHVLADVVGPDEELLSRPVYSASSFYPGNSVAPLLSVQDVGRGRTAYVSGMIAGSGGARNEHLDVLLRQVIEWLSRSPLPLRLTKACPGVRACLDALPDDQGWLLYLVNESTSGFASGALTWTCPQRDIDIHLQWPWPERPRVETLAGGPFSVQAFEGKTIVLRMDELDVYAACRILRE